MMATVIEERDRQRARGGAHCYEPGEGQIRKGKSINGTVSHLDEYKISKPAYCLPMGSWK